MDNENIDNDDFIEIQLTTNKWLLEQSDQLLKQYKAYKTEHAKNKLRPKLELMMGKLQFECRTLSKYIDLE